MKKVPSNHGKPWNKARRKALKKLAALNTPTGLIAWKLGRTKDSIESEASKSRISLKPVNQSPYNRLKSRNK